LVEDIPGKCHQNTEKETLIDFEESRESEQMLNLEHCGVLAVGFFARIFPQRK
jgi:hypothetical protein